MNFDDASLSSLHTYRVKTRQQQKGIQPSIQKSKRKYCHISPDRKNQLISLVLDKKLRIKDAASICSLNYSTAKTILYTLRHRPPKSAVVKPISNSRQQNMTMKILIKGKLVNEYDFYAKSNQS
ncbi:unnamed protein product (macronuclear) [Paramecium tetraurelia]|uniref:HTH psq-type domain-containing protein n=1 Tax=Paramecium tetraurelia TaxID=5888 RepID=A0CV17_PARTE|nr:uncharacterized protein GSPATT00010802001 [Paramecium tetraurelia]CAK74634.1 unnamed protein product [Paramecium tetraurelia]|eukprot:XP_001442031.1 hypothetical protein (macronuclear) [Paramecium tetraurelia strain d4-2]